MVAMIATVIAAGMVGAAFAADDGENDRDPLTADQVYKDFMPLREIARASQGDPGQVAPPCPAEEVVTQLKKAGLQVGPCDPFPEDGKAVILVDEPDPDERAGAVNCPMVIGSKTYPDLRISLPCAPGAKVIDYQPVKSETGACMDLTYIAREGEDEVTERLCPGDVSAAGGTPMGDEFESFTKP